MKLLIVDDEEHVREGIELSINWSSYDITDLLMAENGLEALQLVRQHQPELIICDMSMPIMDGPQFLQQLREEGWASKVIVLSGYQEFNYTRATLLANGIDYLLKPFKISDLDKVIGQACEQIRQEQESKLKELSTNFRLNEVNHLVNEQRFSRLIEEEQGSAAALASFLDSIGIPPEQFYVVTFLPRNKEMLIKHYYARDEQLFNFAMKNIAQELIEPLGNWYAIQHDAFFIVFISTNQLIVDIERTVLQLQEAWRRTLRLFTFAGFHKGSVAAGNLYQVLLEERSMILNCNILDQTGPFNKSPVSHMLIDKERVIVEAALMKNKVFLFEWVDSIQRELEASGSVTLRELQHYTTEINLLLLRIYPQLIDDRFHETMPLWLTLLDEWSRRLKHIFSELLEMIDYDKIAWNHVQPIAAVRNYIHDHMKEDITLAGLAERFHFSSQYLAKKFKEEYDMTVMNYLTVLRMDKACSLLTHTELSIQDIATESGFEELNYFSKVFKKHTGMSPSSYRKDNKA